MSHPPRIVTLRARRSLREEGIMRDGGPTGLMFWGVDIASRALHAVGIDDQGRIVGSLVAGSSEIDALRREVGSSNIVAIDAPDQWSAAHHADDEGLPGKFRNARCAEISLRAMFGYSVSWPTPSGIRTRSSWMELGMEVHRSLNEVAHCIEVFPHACFLHLSGRWSLPKKSSAEGLRARAEILAGHVQLAADELALWSTDSLDALAAAVTARDAASERADVAACDLHEDGSAIYLPSARP